MTGPKFEGPWRVEAVETEDYPGLIVTEGYRRGSIRTKPRGLELWCWVPELIQTGDYDWMNEAYSEVGITPEQLSLFFYYLLNQRGEFGRLICVLADLERSESEDDFDPWWVKPDRLARARAALESCLEAVGDAEDRLAAGDAGDA